MFSPLNLFQNIPCPRPSDCTRRPCFFSHRDGLPLPPPLCLPSPALLPAKRPDPPTQSSSLEPPRKLQKLAPLHNPLPLPASPQQNSGVPALRVVPAQSIVPVPQRQTMLKTLYDHFVVLYNEILPQNPGIAAEHSLKQEEEIYRKSTKHTYRIAVIQCAGAIKRRPTPNSLAHDSVGTEEELIARVEARKLLESLHITRAHLEPLVHSTADLEKAGYFIRVPDGSGGLQPSLEGKVTKCERCCQPFLVQRKSEADQCIFHWGRPYTTIINGDKTRIYKCCSRAVSDPEGCTHGPHVFYESKAEELHSRYPFSFLKDPASASAALDVACIDCEMIYTTGGLQVARVSLVDGSGSQVFDQLVRLNDGVDVIDYNTRFSGITEEEHSKALLPLSSIRETLDSFINADTILVGHGLENDLKTLRIMHLKCIDTSILLPHRAGLPYRRSLRDLVREHLGRTIQTGDGTVGHSSVEDAIATIDLVRWYILNKSS
ncbi:hypothetical protein M378DRAFT_100578 [Amanita muscaria Koide BX008]|uniref:Exonuclease domain-containing protein n=1 Tax=Amanita muscaria (strain Koide BX008) TaxID=946122 RepID=A0A0C2TLS6_AMAMK|nr:hypothetical protein M378DRAFT_100578 [Amanita muscaria Koide BX008]